MLTVIDLSLSVTENVGQSPLEIRFTKDKYDQSQKMFNSYPETIALEEGNNVQVLEVPLTSFHRSIFIHSSASAPDFAHR